MGNEYLPEYRNQYDDGQALKSCHCGPFDIPGEDDASSCALLVQFQASDQLQTSGIWEK